VNRTPIPNRAACWGCPIYLASLANEDANTNEEPIPEGFFKNDQDSVSVEEDKLEHPQVLALTA